MAKIAIVYFTHTDATGKLVDACGGAFVDSGHVVYEHKILGSEIAEGRFINQTVIDELKDADAIVFASPTYMGGPAAQFKALADATSDCWSEQLLSGKLAAGITCGGAPNGDQSSTLQYFVTLANQHGMIWVGLDTAHGFKNGHLNPLGCQLGVTAISKAEQVDEAYLKTAQYLGQRLLKILENNVGVQ